MKFIRRPHEVDMKFMISYFKNLLPSHLIVSKLNMCCVETALHADKHLSVFSKEHVIAETYQYKLI